ncbi:SDR family oxidoreductase [Polymorphum gilvum]|uniref:NAD dependent epimerase/dehydratase family n=1 Tax=Polymorphum gilvum (strain LMG 25793 / CGMCC 1.9160 / SL003B-26A1) TaxID=991905 RepID=F2J2W5_POLGS|nr:SDR family oxidoreductase [Polymorphum gilvum]ADZ72139.1 NAD dependent epimerase/dehydratase family [Polymorphum gilvum SL003B-26A1]
MRLFIFGIGYSSRAFIDRVRDRFDWIGGTTRSPEKAARLKDVGVEPFLFDGTEPGGGIRDALAQASHVLLSIAPDEAGDPALIHHGADIAAGRPHWIGYLSTVGVYGDHHGEWVDEDTPCRPVSKRSVQRVAAEQAWLRFADEHGVPVAIFRLSGIYGPGRNALVNLMSGTARRLVKPGQVFNRIHVEDIAGALEASLARPRTRIYNVTDDEPSPPQDVVAYAADLLGVEPPPEIPFQSADLSPMARSFYGENKRVSNQRIKAELGFNFRFSTYRIALEHLKAEIDSTTQGNHS